MANAARYILVATTFPTGWINIYFLKREKINELGNSFVIKVHIIIFYIIYIINTATSYMYSSF